MAAVWFTLCCAFLGFLVLVLIRAADLGENRPAAVLHITLAVLFGFAACGCGFAFLLALNGA